MFKTYKTSVILLVILFVGLVSAGAYVWKFNRSEIVDKPTESPQPTDTASPPVSPEPTPAKSPSATKTPLPSGDGKTTFINEAVPWSLLLGEASCQLKGEIKFLNANTYDNQDALFIYNGIDHPGRNVKWTLSPADNSFDLGPNIFSRIPIPNGQELLGVFPNGNPQTSRVYEVTATIEYGRLVDKDGKFVTVGGDVKIFNKKCDGKTVILLP